MAGTTTRQRYLDAVVEAMVREGRTDLTLVVLLLSAVIIFAEGSAIAPFIYTIF